MNEVDDNHGYKEVIEYAGFWVRLGSTIIDILVMIPIIVLNYFNQMDYKSIVLMYLLTIISVLYKPLMEWRYGATLGKMANKLKVVSEDLKPISIDQSFGRYIPWLISVVIQTIVATSIFTHPDFLAMDTYEELVKMSQNNPISIISNVYSIVFILIVGWLLFDPKHQGLHDKIAKTFCIKTGR